MSAEPTAKGEQKELSQDDHKGNGNGALSTTSENDVADTDEEEDEEEEPRLKYTKLTANLASVYRNGDDTSTFIVAGDKMVIGTHNGNIHTLSVPSLQPIRLYHAHSASVTALSISPVLPTPSAGTVATINKTLRDIQQTPSTPSAKTPAGQTSRQASRPSVPNIPTNQIYIASASIDGHVCVSSLVDPSDVTLRNFKRPIQAVALSPEYKSDRMYLSGGLAGTLVLTVGGKAGVTAEANTNSAAAAASGWLGSIGLTSNTGKDTVLHSGEGAISTIKFSRTGKFVVWINEHGIKIMRSHLKLESADADHAWKRIAHIDRPNRRNWEEMANVWKARAQWISDKQLETEDLTTVTNGHTQAKTAQGFHKRTPEKLLVGWGDTAWILHVHGERPGAGSRVGERSIGSADIVHKFTFDDCIVSGLSLYTPSLLAILAYRTRDDDDKPIAVPTEGTPRRHRQTGLSPELRLISVESGEEMDVDTLPVSRFSALSAADYHLGPLWIPPPPQQTEAQQKGTLESLGSGFWDVSNNATRIFSSSASIHSVTPSNETRSPAASTANAKISTTSRPTTESVPGLSSAGLKIFIHTPYDCIMAVKREPGDHLAWLMEHKKYSQAWELVDLHPYVVTSTDKRADSTPSTPSRQAGSLADFFADENASQTTVSATRPSNPAAANEKRRIGDLWIQQLVGQNDWKTAGEVAGRVLGTSTRWEHWVLTFAQADRFDEITPHIPSTDMKPALPSFVYEVILGHYIGHDRQKFADLLDRWDPELFDISSVVTAIEDKLDSQEVSEETVEDGEQGRDWRILLDGLAKLKLAAGKPKEALRCYVRLQNADAAMSLIRDYNLLDAISDDIPGLLMLRVSREQLRKGDLQELDDASTEVVQILVDEALSGVVQPEAVVSQLRRKGASYQPFLFFYLRSLWQGPQPDPDRHISRVERLNNERIMSEGRLIVERYADLAVELFADHDRDVLMNFLRNSVAYHLDNASQICENKHFIPELVYLLGKTGQTKRALFLIIGDLGDVSQAISFTKENPDLWEDLLDYSMNKPDFIRALLSEVGTSINPIQLIRRIPDGLEIQGLKEGIQKMVREYDIQYSISEGVAKVFRGEVGTGMDTLRAGQKRGVKFDVQHHKSEEVEINIDPVSNQIGIEGGDEEKKIGISKDKIVSHDNKPGHCVSCELLFEEDDSDFLVGFACGHIFHLTCLLDTIDASDSDYRLVEDLQNQTAIHTDSGGFSTRTVGAKVAHAQIIRSAVKGGCPVCIEAD